MLPVPSGFCRAGAKQFDITSSTAVSSDILFAAGCGTSRVTFAARDGQRLNVSIVDFTHADSADDVRACLNYMELRDVTTGDAALVCAGTERVRHVVTSSASKLQAALQLHNAKKQRFLLRIDGNVTSCSVV